MKIGGVEVNGPAEEVLVLPRMNGDLVFRAKAITDNREFERLCPEPKAKPVLKAGGWQKNTDDPTYKQQLADYSEARWNYTVIKSLEPSEIGWERVQLDKPSSWKEWEKELLDAGLSTIEVNRITVLVMQANALDERKLEAARESFLRGLREAEGKSSGPSTEPQNTQSGQPASDSE